MAYTGDATSATGRDRLTGGPGLDSMTGDNWSVQGTATGASSDLIYGGDDEDQAVGDSRGDYVTGAAADRIDGGRGSDSLTGDSFGYYDATGAADDVLIEGPGDNGYVVGDSEALFGKLSGAGGDDVISLGDDGGYGAVGDHATFYGTASGSGNDIITGGAANEEFIGDSAFGAPVG